MILIDSNVPMFLVGSEHPLKAVSRRLLEGAIDGRERLVTDVVVLHEILRRYTEIDRRDAIGPAFDVLLGVADRVYPVEAEDVERARRLVTAATVLSARVAIHAAVMQRRDVDRILSFDPGFDTLPGLTRLSG